MILMTILPKQLTPSGIIAIEWDGAKNAQMEIIKRVNDLYGECYYSTTFGRLEIYSTDKKGMMGDLMFKVEIDEIIVFFSKDCEVYTKERLNKEFYVINSEWS